MIFREYVQSLTAASVQDWCSFIALLTFIGGALAVWSVL